VGSVPGRLARADPGQTGAGALVSVRLRSRAAVTAQMASAAMTSEVCRAIAVNSVGWHWSSPKQPSVHWLRDTAYAEDANTGYAGNGPRVMASLLNIAVSLLHLSGVLRSPHHPGHQPRPRLPTAMRRTSQTTLPISRAVSHNRFITIRAMFHVNTRAGVHPLAGGGESRNRDESGH